MVLGTSALAGITLALAQGQMGLSIGGQAVRLEPPVAVAIGIKDVNWQREGRALMYDAEDADGYHQGLFRTADGKGKAVLRLAPGTQFHDWKWFPKKLAVVEIVSREDPQTGVTRWSLYTLDAQTLTAREIMGWNFPKGEAGSVSMDLSPILDHALVTVRDSKSELSYVLLDNGGSLVLSPDLGNAKKQGSTFMGWSAQGTAYFSAPGVTPETSDVATLDAKRGEGGLVHLQFFTQSSSSNRVPVLGDLPIIGRLFLSAAKTAPSPGTPVLELMSWNGGLRPVRSRGPFEEVPFEPVALEPKPEAAQVLASLLRGQSGALWLVPELREEGRPRDPGGLLVAAEAGQSWFNPTREWIAYETAGALFVRKVLVGR